MALPRHHLISANFSGSVVNPVTSPRSIGGSRLGYDPRVLGLGVMVGKRCKPGVGFRNVRLRKMAYAVVTSLTLLLAGSTAATSDVRADQSEAPAGPRAYLARQSTMGNGHACVIDEAAKVLCWGLNLFQQLGPTVSASTHPYPTVIDGVGEARQIAAALQTNCVVRADTTVVCWGYSPGIMPRGLDSLISNPIPTVVPGLIGVSSVAGGGATFCAVMLDQSAKCWGASGIGQLGDGLPIEPGNGSATSMTPRTVAGLTNVEAVTVGGFFGCALLYDGTVWCWGLNNEGQLGSGMLQETSVPSPVVGVSGVTAISAGFDHTCALRADQTVWCWGTGRDGRLGNGSVNISVIPSQVPISDVTSIGAGVGQTCVTRVDGSVWCWGLYEPFGGTVALVPERVIGISDAAFVTAGGSGTCVAREVGDFWCWGAGLLPVGGRFPAQVSGIQLADVAVLSDSAPPVVAGTFSPAANQAGWHHSPVVVSWTVQDPSPSSGLAATPGPTEVNGEGANQLVVSTPACDAAGNCAVGSVTVSVDLTPPEITVVAPSQVAPADEFTVSCAAFDALSGVASSICSTVSATGAALVEGINLFEFEATDRAGNRQTIQHAVSLTLTAQNIGDLIGQYLDDANGTNGIRAALQVKLASGDLAGFVAQLEAQCCRLANGKRFSRVEVDTLVRLARELLS